MAKDMIAIKKVAIKDISPAKYNPRKISEEALAGLQSSLKEFGFVDPLIVNKRNNVLVGGHQRLKAAEKLGIKEVPVVYVDLDEAKEKALNIALNSEKISGEFDAQLLHELVNEIQADIPELLESLRIDDLLKDYKFEEEKLEPMQDDELSDMVKNSDLDFDGRLFFEIKRRGKLLAGLVEDKFENLVARKLIIDALTDEKDEDIIRRYKKFESQSK